MKPAIPGADLVPDIVLESDEFLDAEARAAAEAEAEEARARAGDEDPVLEAQPIADATIDLASGARYRATGKRKTAVARVILKPGTGAYEINGKPLESFFPRETLQRVIRQPLETVGYDARMDVVARMHGGGVSAQAGALRHGISRALLEADPNLRGELKRRGFLTRDPRVKERRRPVSRRPASARSSPSADATQRLDGTPAIRHGWRPRPCRGVPDRGPGAVARPRRRGPRSRPELLGPKRAPAGADRP